MNVTQVIQSAVQQKSKGKETEINVKDFSKAFEKYTSSSDSKRKKQTSEEIESEELKEQAPDSTEQSESETEPAPFTLINPFLNLDAQVTDLSALGEHFILHKEPSNSEVSLIAVTQLIAQGTEGDLGNMETLTINSELTNNLSQEQLAALASLTESDQLIEGKTLSEVADEVSKLMEGDALKKAVEADGLKQAGNSVEASESSTIKANTELNEQSKTGSPTSIKSESLDSDTKQTLVDLNKVSMDSEASDQITNKKPESVRQTSKNSDLLQPVTGNKSPLIEEGSKEKSTLETSRLTDQAELTETTLPEGKVKESASQTDTEYDFVSMLRQLSSQSTKTQNQSTVKTMPENNTPVPKEQGMNLIQDMVTSLVENKEGQKTYQTTLHLTPETLGKVTVELSFNEEGLSGKLTFQSDEARRWMEGEWLDLKLPLESKGVTVKSFDFATSQPATQQQNSFSFSEQSSQSGQDAQRQATSDKERIGPENDDLPVEAAADQTSGLNVYV